MQARDRCQEEGKQLCTSRQWKDACEAKDYRRWSFGKQLPPAGQPAPCNWQAAGPAASGSFASCYNQIGAYDMSGNLAEWTSDGERPGEAYQAGGFYASSPDDAHCASRISVPQSKPPAPQAGFRCCKKLED
jgi:formylglycine-generating enzyme required for sulfatase activity